MGEEEALRKPGGAEGGKQDRVDKEGEPVGGRMESRARRKDKSLGGIERGAASARVPAAIHWDWAGSAEGASTAAQVEDEWEGAAGVYCGPGVLTTLAGEGAAH